MKIKDRVYGVGEINEPVLLELINSKPVQRLKGIHQAGSSYLALPNRNLTRYEHSVGVMLLLKKFNASLEEQIAGLLHDIPHTAFSHVIDFVFKKNNNNHDFHEKYYEQIVKNSEIPEILKKHNIDLDHILDEHNFPLLERNLPDLCADRIDYTFRDLIAIQNLQGNIDTHLNDLIVYNNEIIFSNKNSAKEFAENYLYANETMWASPLEVTLYYILADAISVALDNKILTEQDLFKQDDEVYNILKYSNNKEILNKLEMLNPNLKIKIDKGDYDFSSKNKIRCIDPKYLDESGNLICVTKTFPEYAQKIEQHKQKIGNGYFIKIISH